MFDVTALGELLVDFTQHGFSESGMRLYEQNPGGAPANVACAVARLGGRAAFIGKVGDDSHGDFLRNMLKRENVDVTGLISDASAFTTLAFVTLSESGERSFSFARKPGADALLRVDELKEDIITNTKIFHFGSFPLTGEPAKSALFKALELAMHSGAVTAFDPNYRALLWNTPEKAAQAIRAVLPFTDIIKLSAEETALVTGRSDPDAAIAYLLDAGVDCAVVTLGEEGSAAATKNTNIIHTKAQCSGEVVDTTGAGDAFWGAFLLRLSQSSKRPADLTDADLFSFSSFANAAACLCVQRRGAIPSLPYLKDLGGRGLS